jgi:hypothetical protein
VKRGGRLPPQSARRRANQALRGEVVLIVWARAGRACWYRPFVPEIECRTYDRTRASLEVDELRGGAYRSTEWLDPDRCRLTCQAHHDWKTDHKHELLERLAAYEQEHPWPSVPSFDAP